MAKILKNHVDGPDLFARKAVGRFKVVGLYGVFLFFLIFFGISRNQIPQQFVYLGLG
jgi:hypothetical protein